MPRTDVDAPAVTALSTAAAAAAPFAQALAAAPRLCPSSPTSSPCLRSLPTCAPVQSSFLNEGAERHAKNPSPS